MSDVTFLTIADAARLLRQRKLSPVELVKALLDRIETLDSQINSFITLTHDIAIDQARQAEKEISGGKYRGPMHGIPFGLKDLFNTRGVLTSGNSQIGKSHIPDYDATATKRLRKAGAILMGKLTCHEFAHGGPSFDLPWPPARNPWNNAHFTGGSSTGSAAAVASGFVLGALGTDTGGSVRNPASHCGVVGIKPTYGLVSRFGIIPHSFSLDHCGPLTWNVEDCSIMLQAIAGYDPKDPGSVKVPIPQYASALGKGVQHLRIGVLRHLWEDDVPAGDEVRAAMEEAISVFMRLGAEVETARIHSAQEYFDVKVVLCESEAFAVQRKDLLRRPLDYGADYLSRVLVAPLFQSADYIRAQRQRSVLVRDMLPLYEKYDLLLTAGLGPAPRLDARHAPMDKWKKPSLTNIFNVTGGPAIMLCNGFSKNGLPLGMQIAGRPFDEETIFRAAHAYEQATNWRDKRPQLVPGRNAVRIRQDDHQVTGPLVDAATRDYVEASARSAGINLPEHLLIDLCAAAPYVRAIAQRIPGHEWNEELASVFQLPNPSKRSTKKRPNT